VMTMAVHSYVSDHSARDRRTQRLSNLVAMSHFGYLVGSVTAGLMLDRYGFLNVFVTVTGIETACVLTAALSMKNRPPTASVSQSSSFTEITVVKIQLIQAIRASLYE